MIALLAITTAGCRIPVEPAAPENVELNVDAGQVTIAWNTPSSWLPLRRYEWRVLNSNATNERLTGPEAGDDEFCYLRPSRNPRIKLPHPAAAEVTLEIRAVYQLIQAHSAEFGPARYSPTEQVTSEWYADSTRLPSDQNDTTLHVPAE